MDGQDQGERPQDQPRPEAPPGAPAAAAAAAGAGLAAARRPLLNGAVNVRALKPPAAAAAAPPPPSPSPLPPSDLVAEIKLNIQHENGGANAGEGDAASVDQETQKYEEIKEEDISINEQNSRAQGTEGQNTMAPPAPVFTSDRVMNDTTMPPPGPRRKVPPAQAAGGRSAGAQGGRAGLRPAVTIGKGFGMLDWVQLNKARTTKELRKITKEEVRQHNTEYDAWTIINGKVYDITPYLPYHPGGKAELMKGAGRDCTALFNKYHPWVNVDSLGSSLLLGMYDDGKGAK